MPWWETLNTWGPLGAICTIGAVAIAAPFLTPAVAASGAIATVAGSAAVIVHLNNLHTVAELVYQSQTGQIEGIPTI